MRVAHESQMMYYADLHRGHLRSIEERRVMAEMRAYAESERRREMYGPPVVVGLDPAYRVTPQDEGANVGDAIGYLMEGNDIVGTVPPQLWAPPGFYEEQRRHQMGRHRDRAVAYQFHQNLYAAGIVGHFDAIPVYETDLLPEGGPAIFMGGIDLETYVPKSGETREDGLNPRDVARDLLLSYLSEAQRADLEMTSAFDVTGSDNRTYRIHVRPGSYNVRMGGDDYCTHVHYKHPVPLHDEMLAQMLLIRTDAKKFLETANRAARGGAGW